MRFLKVTTWSLAGMLAGLFAGYALWGEPMDTHQRTLDKVSAELATTKTWLWDEIRTSDERYERVSSSLAQALSDLSAARAELARIKAAARVAGAGASTLVEPTPPQSAGAGEGVTGSVARDGRPPSTVTETSLSVRGPASR